MPRTKSMNILAHLNIGERAHVLRVAPEVGVGRRKSESVVDFPAISVGATRMGKKKTLNKKLQAWIDARKRHRLSHAQVQMARELGMNPIKLGKLDNHDQEPWKMPLRQYIEHLYFKRFGKERPDSVLSIEEKIRLEESRKARKQEAKRMARQAAATGMDQV